MNARTRIEIIAPIAILVVLLVGNAFWYGPRKTELLSLSRKLARAEQRFRDAQVHADDLTRTAPYLPRKEFGDDEGGQRFLTDVTGELRSLGLTLNRLQPQSENDHGEFVRRNYRLEVDGKFVEFVDFLEYLEQLPELIVVESFDTRSREAIAGNEHRMTVVLNAYSY